MNKPMGPKVPARDLRESEFMLREEKRGREEKDFWKGAFMLVGGLGGLVLCALLFVYGVLQWASVIPK